MKIQSQLVILVTMVLITGCGSELSPKIEPYVPGMSTQVQEKNEPMVERLVATEMPMPVEAPASPAERTAPNCLGDEIHPIGQAIAEEYESASYEQVITWFCNGAEFEDILVALETDTLVDSSTDEMLEMLADGFTWEEIWQLVGLTD